MVKELKEDKTQINWKFCKKLGQGAFGACYSVENVDTGEIWAMKLPLKKAVNTDHKRKIIEHEIQIHHSMKCDYVCSCESHFEDQFRQIFIVLEVCASDDLKELTMKKRGGMISEFEARYYTRQLAIAIKYMHTEKIIHRDLKPANVFLNDKLQCKVGDFGLAIKTDGRKHRSQSGTPLYMCPEMLRDDGYSYESDIWAFGVIIYYLLFGRTPFVGQNVNYTFANIKRGKFRYPSSGQELSDHAKDLLNRCFDLDPLHRITIHEILNHSFYTSE